MPLQLARRDSTVIIPSADMPGSSDTESDSQRTFYVFNGSFDLLKVAYSCRFPVSISAQCYRDLVYGPSETIASSGS